jgi:hypothetical protein
MRLDKAHPQDETMNFTRSCACIAARSHRLIVLLLALLSVSTARADVYQFAPTNPDGGMDGWRREFGTRPESPFSIAPASNHPDGQVFAARCTGQYVRTIDGRYTFPPLDPQRPAVLMFDALPRDRAEASFGLVQDNLLPTRMQIFLGPTFGITQNQFFVRAALHGEMACGAMRAEDSPDHWYRLKLEIQFNGHDGDGAATLYVRNLSRGQAQDTLVLRDVPLGLKKMPEMARHPRAWNALYIRGGVHGPRLFTEIANLNPHVITSTTADVPQRTALPQFHEWQKTLRDHIASYKPDDFAVEIKPFTAPPPAERSRNELFRLWLQSDNYAKPDIRVMRATAEMFTLAGIEQGDQVMIPGPPALFFNRPTSTSYIWFATADVPGNPYRGDQALIRRALVLDLVDLIMLDRQHELNMDTRSDFLGGSLIWLAYNYRFTRELMPAAVRAAYETALRRFAQRLAKWGPTGLMTDMDLFVPVGMAYLMQALPDDEEVKRIAHELSQRLFTDPRYFNPAGYFCDLGLYDVSYNGISLYFTTWAAQVGGYPEAKAALEKAFRLRSTMMLPDLGGVYAGPTHFSSRTSYDAPMDQWGWPQRNLAAAALTDHALHTLTTTPPNIIDMLDSPQLAKAPGKLVDSINAALKLDNKAEPTPWKERHWTSSPCFALDVLTDEYLARLDQLKREGSPLLKPAMARAGDSLERFGESIVTAKRAGYSAIFYTGPAGWDSGSSFHGLGGGTLSGFATPQAGVVLLGRRSGFQGTKTPDSYEQAPSWPVHAVTARIAGAEPGLYVSSARCRRPRVSFALDAATPTIDVLGDLPSRKIADRELIRGSITYQRTFSIEAQSVHVRTTLQGDGADEITECFETLPIYLGDERKGKLQTVTWSAWKQGQWVDLGTEALTDVERVRIGRGTGEVLVQFDSPATVRLSESNWQDSYQSRATARNLMIQLPARSASGQAWTSTWGWRLSASDATPARP